MLRAKIEVVPFGVESDTREIGTLTIINEGRLPAFAAGIRAYAVFVNGRKLGQVTHRREQRHGAYKLVKKALGLIK